MDRPEHKQGEHAVFLVGPSGIVTSWNDDCVAMLGHGGGQAIHLPLAELLAPGARPAMARALAASSAWQSQFYVEFLLAGGGQRMFCVTLTPQWGPRNKARGHSVMLKPATAAMPADSISERERIACMPLHAMVNLLPGTFYIIDKHGKMVMWNTRVEQVTGLNPHEVEANSVFNMFLDKDVSLVAARIEAVFEHNEEVVLEVGLRAKGGGVTPYLFTGTRFGAAGNFYLCGMGLDLTERRKQEEQLRLHQRALQASSNGIYIVRRVGAACIMEHVNPAFEQITGYHAADVLGRDSHGLIGLFTGAEEDEDHARIHAALAQGHAARATLRSVRKNGEAFWNDLTIAPVRDEGGELTHFIGVINDVTESKQRTSRLEHEINHDVLTGLPNRNLMWDRLEHAVALAQRGKSLVAVVLIDLDKFKEINDTLGHEAGDEVLRIVARKMQAAVRDSDTVARLGGDEFVMILANQPSARYTLRMIERLRDDLSSPVRIAGEDLCIASSMGVAVYPHDGAGVAELIEAADVAMYHAKNAGRNDVHFFSADMKTDSDTKHRLKQDLQRALDEHELFLLFQPKLSLLTGKVVGAEALLRWRHPSRGVIGPLEFIAEAEENGLIVPIGDWVARQVCSVLDQLHALGLAELVVAMNASYPEFSRRRYVALLCELLTSSKVVPERFELEISETNLLRDVALTHPVFHELRQAGIGLTVGDFGAGLASLKHLDDSPVSCVKIYKPYISKLGSDPVSARAARTMIAMAHLMRVKVLGEGVETREQLEFLRANGCDHIQGNYVGVPVALHQLTEMALRTNRQASLH